MSAPQITWLSPLYRTRDFVERLCERVGAVSASLGLSHEIVLVDDACPQGSADEAERIAAHYPMRVIRLARNGGQDAALHRGLGECRGEWVVMIDADLQDPPEALARLWPQTDAGFDVVFANRHGVYQIRGRLITSWLYRRVASLIGRLPEGAGNYALIHRRTYQAIAAAPLEGTLLAAIARVPARRTSVPVRRDVRTSGKSAYSGLDRARKAARTLIQLSRARLGALRITPSSSDDRPTDKTSSSA
jgi:glycosyltransferase involved in cell wall biosynthesis